MLRVADSCLIRRDFVDVYGVVAQQQRPRDHQALLGDLFMSGYYFDAGSHTGAVTINMITRGTKTTSTSGVMLMSGEGGWGSSVRSRKDNHL